MLWGRCRTTVWEDLFEADPKPYEKEIEAVDGCRLGDVIIAAAEGSMRSGIWGELLSHAAWHRGSAGALVDGGVRDTPQMKGLGFTCFARGHSGYDSRDRQRVTDVQVPVQVGGVIVHPGDLVFGDPDGIVIIPQAHEADVLTRAEAKLQDENRVRRDILGGRRLGAVYDEYGVL